MWIITDYSSEKKQCTCEGYNGKSLKLRWKGKKHKKTCSLIILYPGLLKPFLQTKCDKIW